MQPRVLGQPTQRSLTADAADPLCPFVAPKLLAKRRPVAVAVELEDELRPLSSDIIHERLCSCAVLATVIPTTASSETKTSPRRNVRRGLNALSGWRHPRVVSPCHRKLVMQTRAFVHPSKHAVDVTRVNELVHDLAGVFQLYPAEIRCVDDGIA